MQPLLLFALFLSATITAFKIDASCSAADADLIRSATLQAVDMANKALDALDKTPRDDDVNRLVKLLFCQDGEDPDTVDLFDVREALKGVEVLGNENPRADVEDSMNDVVSSDSQPFRQCPGRNDTEVGDILRCFKAPEERARRVG